MTTQSNSFVPANLAPRIAARGIDVFVLVCVDVGLGKLMGSGSTGSRSGR